MIRRRSFKRRIACDGIKANPAFILARPTLFEPRCKVFALTDVEGLELSTPICHCFNTVTSDSDTATDGKVFQMQEMKADAA